MPVARGRHPARPRLRPAWLTGLALAAVLAALVVPMPVAAWDWTTPKIDFLSEETMRLVNYDRAGNGLPDLVSDPKLVTLARDLAWKCPTSTLSVRGRARDMTERAYLSHSIKGCYKSGSTLYSVLDILASPFGYTSYRGEIIASNYKSVAATRYAWGCDSVGTNCNGSLTTAATVAAVEYWWMHDAPHRAIILGTHYDRFGCGMWRGTDGKNLYSCLFARGGPNPLDTAALTVVSATGDGASVAQGASLTLSAVVSDNFRLAEGWVRLDATSSCRGPTIDTWADNLNVVTETHSFTWNTAGVPKGTHAIGWQVRDVSVRASSCFIIHVTVT